MEFTGPSAADFDNVRALNRAFLRLLKADPAASRCLQGLEPSLAANLSSLADGAAERLASTPFLLLSFRERDDDFWEAMFAAPSTGDLFVVPQTPSDDLGRLISAGLGFVWQLAKQNPFAARLICGASLHWSEQLTERTLFRVLATAGTHAEILALRCGTDTGIWSKLLQCGVSREKQVRRAAHISALQSVLTRASQPNPRKWAAAACAVKTPTLQVADQRKY